MSFTVTTPPSVGELSAAIVALLDVASMQALLGGASRITTVSEEPAQLSDDAIARIVVMRRETPSREHLDRVRFVDFNLRLDSLRPGGTFDLDLFHERVHAEMFSLLEGVTPSLTLAGVVHPLRRIDTPSPTREHAPEGFHYSRSPYRLAVGAA